MSSADVTVVILTYNEILHIERCVRSVQSLAGRVVVVDSFSTDGTVERAKQLGCEVIQHRFKTQADQLTWALETLAIASAWTMRIDADELISTELAEGIRAAIASASDDIGGIQLARTIRFQNHIVRHGGFPYWQLRVWRTGHAHVESRWMDEHMVLDRGRAIRVDGLYLDDNLNDLGWWISKHGAYAAREAVDLLLRKHENLYPEDEHHPGLPVELRFKRVMKQHVYERLPPGPRALALFTYRMLLRGGIRDGLAGLPFHLLQGLWYRYLVDLMVRAVEDRMARERLTCREAIRRELKLEPSAV